MSRPTGRELHEYYMQKAKEVDELKVTYAHPNWYRRAFYMARFQAVFDALDPQPNERILDIGAGPGYYSRRIARKEARVVSIDIARAYLLQVPHAVGGRVAADAHALPFQSRTFDRVLATEVLEHTLNPNDVLREAARVLKTGGQAVITSPCSSSYMDRLYEVKVRIRRYTFKEHLQQFSREEFLDLLSHHFRVVELRFANCLVPYPLDMIAMRIPERIGSSVFTKLESHLSGGRAAAALCWTMIAVLENAEEDGSATAS